MQDVLIKHWSRSGLKKNDNILLHSSFKRTIEDFKKKRITITHQNILDSFLDLTYPNGTLVIPTFNFDFNDGADYDYYKTKSQMGVLTEIARNHPSAKRTLNPVYSFAVFGKESKLFDSIDNKSWYSKESPFAIIHNLNFKICIIDLRDRNSMTFAHYCEEYLQVPWKFYKKFTGKYTDKFKKTSLKEYKGYVRKLNEGVLTTLDPAGDLLWSKNLYKGFKPFQENGLRYVYAKDYFNLFEKLFKNNDSKPYYYDIKK